MNKSGKFWLAVLLLNPLFWYTEAMAHQQALIIQPNAEVFEHPSRTSQQILYLKIGTEVQISSNVTQDATGTTWYKIKLDLGGYGYIEATAINGESLWQDLKASGTQMTPYTDTDLDRDRWRYEARVVGMAGMELSTGIFESSLESELTYSISLAPEGIYHRLLSVGAAFLIFDNRDPAFLGSIVVRPFEELAPQLTPEFRVRVGMSFGSALPLVGGSLGLNYAFAVKRTDFYCGYLELGTLEKPLVSFYHLWVAVGLGYHF